MTTYRQAFESWDAEIKPAVIKQYGADDIPALSESWNNYTDSLCKDGELTDLQYSHCPAWDDEMPDCDATHVLESLGVKFTAVYVVKRPDGLMKDMPGATHWRVTMSRGRGAGVTKRLQVYYSMGSAHTGEPELADVFYSLLMDSSDVGCEFEEWAVNLGLDTDSRKAVRIYNACRKVHADLMRLFTGPELSDLRELFADY